MRSRSISVHNSCRASCHISFVPLYPETTSLQAPSFPLTFHISKPSQCPFSSVDLISPSIQTSCPSKPAKLNPPYLANIPTTASIHPSQTSLLNSQPAHNIPSTASLLYQPKIDTIPRAPNSSPELRPSPSNTPLPPPQSPILQRTLTNSPPPHNLADQRYLHFILS